jgi:hypothetical protein
LKAPEQAIRILIQFRHDARLAPIKQGVD